MGIVEAVKKGFALSGKLLNVVAIFFVLNVIMGLVGLPLGRPENIAQPGIAMAGFGLSVVFFLIFIFIQGGALGLARDIHKTGNPDMANFVAYGKKYYVRILVLLLLFILIAVGVVLILGLIGSGILAIADNPFTRTLIGVIATVVALVAIVILLFPVYSIVADENGVIAAFKKGVKVGRDNFRQVLGLFLLLLLVSVVISVVIGFILGLISVPLPLGVSQVLVTVVNSAVQSYIPIVMMLALMGYYLGLSKGSEGGPSQT